MDFDKNKTVTRLSIDGNDFVLGEGIDFNSIEELIQQCADCQDTNPTFFLINQSGRRVYFNFNNIHSIEVFTE